MKNVTGLSGMFVYINIKVVNYNKKNKSPGNWANKSNLSTGYRYYDGKMVNTSPVPHSSQSPENSKQYLFEALIGMILRLFLLIYLIYIIIWHDYAYSAVIFCASLYVWLTVDL